MKFFKMKILVNGLTAKYTYRKNFHVCGILPCNCLGHNKSTIRKNCTPTYGTKYTGYMISMCKCAYDCGVR